jgi:PAS domain S-box-containing protein
MQYRTVSSVKHDVLALRILAEKWMGSVAEAAETSRTALRLQHALGVQIKLVAGLLDTLPEYARADFGEVLNALQQTRNLIKQSAESTVLRTDLRHSLQPAVNRLLGETGLIQRHSKAFQANAWGDLLAVNNHAIISKTDRYGTIVSANAKFVEISGYSLEELIGEDHAILNSGVHPKGFFNAVWKTLLRGELWQGTICNRTKNGTLYWVESTIQPILNRMQQTDHFISIRTDVTALKLAEQQAEQANQAKSEFLSSMSHELRTPLNSVIGFADLLALSDKLDEKHLRQVDNIRQSGRHLLALINQVLELSKIETGALEVKHEPVSLDEVIANALLMVQPMADQAEVRLLWGAEHLGEQVIQADYTQVKQVLLNYLSNAIKYNKPDGTVTVQCRRFERAGAGTVRISVIDTGVGIAAGKQAKVFEPFNRLGFEGKAIEGTGIGLAITQKLVALMGGQVGFSSAEHQGSEFWFELPLNGSAQPALKSADMQAENVGQQPPSNRTRRLLYIDDNLARMQRFSDVMAHLEEVELSIAPTPLLGVEKAETLLPDCIVLDFAQAEDKTFSALGSESEWRKHGGQLVALVDTKDKGEQAMAKLGFDDYLIDPVDRDQLKRVRARMGN